MIKRICPLLFSLALMFPAVLFTFFPPAANAQSNAAVLTASRGEITNWFAGGKTNHLIKDLNWDCARNGIAINLTVKMKENFAGEPIVLMNAVSKEGKKVEIGVRIRNDGHLYVYDNPFDPDAYVFCAKNRRTMQWLAGETHHLSCGFTKEEIFVAFADSYGSAPADATDPKRFPQYDKFFPMRIESISIANTGCDIESLEVFMDSAFIKGKPNTLENLVCKIVPPARGIFVSPQVLLPASGGFVITSKEGYLTKNPRLVVECPPGISPYNELTVGRVCRFPFNYDARGIEQFEKDRKTYNRYRFHFPHTIKDQVTVDRFFSWYLTWGTSLPAGEAPTAVQMFMEWDGGSQPPVTVPVKVLDIPLEVGRFEVLPIGLWGSPFTTGIKGWCSKVGINYLAPHIPEIDNDADVAVLKEARERLAGTGIDLDFYSMKIWYGHKWEGDKALMRIDGSRNNILPCLSYRGKEFYEDGERARRLVLKGVDGIYTDIEAEHYRGCFCERCQKGFQAFLKKNYPKLEYMDPKEVEKTRPSAYPELHKAWLEYMGLLMSEYYLSLCDGMSKAAQELKRKQPLRLTIYNDADRRVGLAGADLSYLLAQKIPGVRVLCGPPLYSGALDAGDRSRNAAKAYGDAEYFPHIGHLEDVKELNMEHVLYEIFTNGAKGFHIWAHAAVDGNDVRGLNAGMFVIKKVENLIARSHLLEAPFDPAPGVRVRAVGDGKETLILVAQYDKVLEPKVEVKAPVQEKSKVVDLKTGEVLEVISPKSDLFTVKFSAPGARLFHVRPAK